MQIQGFLNWNLSVLAWQSLPTVACSTATMHLMHTLDEAGNRVYTLKVSHTILCVFFGLFVYADIGVLHRKQRRGVESPSLHIQVCMAFREGGDI
jgi:hypothetical protein